MDTQRNKVVVNMLLGGAAVVLTLVGLAQPAGFLPPVDPTAQPLQVASVVEGVLAASVYCAGSGSAGDGLRLLACADGLTVDLGGTSAAASGGADTVSRLSGAFERG
jgi:hypothetical protein